jgi:hypothetical protein
MLRNFFNLLNTRSELLSLHLELGSPTMTQPLKEASSKVMRELDRSNIPSPDPSLTPILIAARWISHDLSNEDMPGIAADLLEAGYDTPALIRLAGEMQIYGSPDADRLIGKAFHELGIPWPLSEVQAGLIATRQIAREVIAGKRDPYRAASHLEVVLWGWRPVTDDLEFLFTLNDEFSWDPEHQRYLPAILQDQLETFARLACLTDEQITLESNNAQKARK